MSTANTPIYQTDQIRELERLAEERFGIAGDVMMQRAGKAALETLFRRFPQAKKISIFCGGGNNGGDGYVLARVAHERGLKVMVWQLGDVEKLKGEARRAYSACQNAGVPIHPFHRDIDLPHSDLFVDAICGIGMHDTVREDVRQAIETIEKFPVPVLAIDIPTGINADTGQVLGKALRATTTITFIGLKLGLLTGNGPSYCGEIILNDLQLPAELFSNVTPAAEKLSPSVIVAHLSPRPRDWHKGNAGHLLIVGGHGGYSGAVLMAAEAALRVGVGLVSIATSPEHAYVLNVARPEIMVHAVSDGELNGLLMKADAVVLGPGLGRSIWSKSLWQTVLTSALPLLIDADGINLLAEHPQSRDNWILTPHPGEAARLLQKTTIDIQKDRLSAIKMIQEHFGGTCVLKGAGSLISASHHVPILCDKGNPGMATAGMGDILSGVIGGLLVQGVPMFDAAAIGVYLHAMAGDLAAKEGERGTIATDLLPYLRKLVNPVHV